MFKLKLPDVLVIVSISGPVKVLFVNVSVPANVAKSLSVNALLNCAVVPETVFDPNAIVLLVNVSVVSLKTI